MLKYLISIIIFCLPNICLAYDYSSDCTQFMTGPVTTLQANVHYTTSDDQGVNSWCHNQFPDWGQKMTLTRIGTSFDNLSYRIERKYCGARNGFEGWSCFWNWFGSWSNYWGDTYSGTIPDSKVTGLSDTSGTGRLILKGASGNPGFHTCLKRIAPNEKYPQSGKPNTSRKTQVCAYVINALYNSDPNISAACNPPGQSPYGLLWSSAFIGCVDIPSPPGPPTFNPTIPGSLTPYVDSSLGLKDTQDPSGNVVKGLINLGSTFGQPVVLLRQNRSTDTLLLRYVFSGDTAIDTIPMCAPFPSSKSSTSSSKLQYCAIVPEDDPSVVCAYESVAGPSAGNLGCVPRPTPADSNLVIYAEYNPITDASGNITPALNVRFVPLNTAAPHSFWGQFVDSKGASVNFDASGIPYTGSNTTVYPPITPVSALALPKTKLQVRELYPAKITNAPDYLNMPDKGEVYGITFNAIIPNTITNLTPYEPLRYNPIYFPFLTQYNRALLDGCNAITFNPNANDPNSVWVYSPAGGRDRKNCSCTSTMPAASCPIPTPTACTDGTVLASDPNAAKVYCPGLVMGSSTAAPNDYSGLQMCLKIVGNWPPASPTDVLCTTIPQSCSPITTPSMNSSYMTWPQPINPGQTIRTSKLCQPFLGNGYTNALQYTINPAQPVPQSAFDCSAFPANCTSAYNDYVQVITTVTQQMQLQQELADLNNRNIYPEIVQFYQNLLNTYTAAAPHTISSTTLIPQRTCDKANTSSVTNGCRVNSNSCVSILSGPTFDPSYGKAYTGYAEWDASTTLSTISTDAGIKKTLPQSYASIKSNQLYLADVEVQGTCDGVKYIQNPAGPPSRTCHLSFSGGVYKSSSWDPNIINPCIPK